MTCVSKEYDIGNGTGSMTTAKYKIFNAYNMKIVIK